MTHSSSSLANDQVAGGSFEEFLQAHPFYHAAYDVLFAANRVVATSAQLVYELYPGELGPVSDDILAFVRSAYPADYIEAYLSRVNRLARLQERFEANPSPQTLGDSTEDRSSAYSLALLLSIVFTNHRFEIMQALTHFLRSLPADSSGSMASIGCGTGFELKLTADLLPGWKIEGYDTDAQMHAKAKQLLEFFHVSKAVDFEAEFPLEAVVPQTEQRYDGVILCEVLEHLPEPAQALATLGGCLKNGGRMFVTMAINMAQEDHIFLYPDIASCRRQIRESGLGVHREWIAPQTIRFPPPNREIGFKKGNYIAIVGKKCGE